LSFSAIFAAASVAAAAHQPPCPGDSTLEINNCLSGQLDAANAVLKRYVATARARIASDTSDPAATKTTLAAFDKAEALWGQYREAECDAVYDNWIAGTIRGAMSLNCQIDLTMRHTHNVWANWLTYMDSTPPVLPEPPQAPPP
jgi:uncharacterized protein YecT (DUF1311 family)